MAFSLLKALKISLIGAFNNKKAFSEHCENFAKVHGQLYSPPTAACACLGWVAACWRESKCVSRDFKHQPRDCTGKV